MIELVVLSAILPVVSQSRVETTFTTPPWQGASWTHALTLDRPWSGRDTETAILVVTGDRVERVDGPFGKDLARRSGLSVATVFQIPNQPLFEKREDDLIAFTFERFLMTGDASWPLLKPMVASAVQAMTAAQELSGGVIKRFVVTGASKRGWTTWLVGQTGDKRVIGIAPMVFDNLNFEAQINRQMELWGKPSEMLGDYESKGLMEALKTDRGRELVAMVDPHPGLPKMTMPKLIITGSNDRYWAPDAMAVYWNDVPEPKAAFTAPNAPHSMVRRAIPVLSEFARACSGGKPLNQPSAEVVGGKVIVRHATKARTVSLWVAESSTMDFRASRWREVKRGHGKLELPRTNKNYAWMAMAHYEGYELTTPVRVVRASDRSRQR